MKPDDLAAKYFLARVLYWRDALDTLDGQAVAQLLKVLESTKADVLARLAADAEGLASITDWNRDRLIQVNAWLTEVTTAAQATTVAAITQASVTAAAASLVTYNAMMSFEGRATAVQSVGMTAGQLMTWFQRTPLQNGTVLSEWVSKAFENGVNDSVISAIQRGGLEGKGTAAMVKDVLQTALDDGFAITQREAITLTRTYTQTANVQAMEAVIQANSDIIKGYKRVETLDNKTCRICALADGAEYGLKEPRPALPAHPGCRGVYTPITKSWRDFGIDLDDLEEVTRPWVMREPGAIGTGGRKILEYGQTTENFSGWWESLSATQKAKTSIGPVRGKLLESGAVSWGDLWDKKTGLPYTLKQLGFDEAGERLSR